MRKRYMLKDLGDEGLREVLRNLKEKHRDKNFKDLCEKAGSRDTTVLTFIDISIDRKSVNEESLKGYYGIWYLLTNMPEDETVNGSEIAKFSSYFVKEEEVRKILEQIFEPHSKEISNENRDVASKKGKTACTDTVVTTKGFVDKRIRVGSKSSKIKWAIQWWNRYKVVALKCFINKYSDYIMINVKAAAVVCGMDISEFIPRRIFIVPFLRFSHEINIINRAKKNDLVVLLHGDNEERYEMEYRKYRSMKKTILELQVNQETMNVDEARVICEEFVCSYEYILSLTNIEEMSEEQEDSSLKN